MAAKNTDQERAAYLLSLLFDPENGDNTFP
jgi:hypothetical protein